MKAPLSRSWEAIVMGASAGSIEALSLILPALPSEYPFPVMVVVHLPPDKESRIAEFFRAKCRVEVKEAEDKEFLQPATVYFAPPNYHLLVENDRSLSLSADEPVLYSRPSIDVLFESAADTYGAGLVGVVLTGANSDGARGLEQICQAGGLGIVQTPQSAQVGTMPEAAIRKCPGATVLTLDEISAFLQGLTSKQL